VLGVNEVYGSSWPQGGIDVGDGGYAPTGNPDEYAFTATVPPFDLAAAGSITFRYAVIYDNSDANKRPLVWIDFGETKTASQLDRMQIASANSAVAIFKVANP